MNKNVLLQNHTFHHSDFKDKKKLVELKQKQRLKISLAFPTLNEELTIEKEILVIRTELVDRLPLLDEIVVIDSGSRDKTREIARECGASVYEAKNILKKYGNYAGKGENLWKSLYILKGDIIVWIDADISNIGPQFVYGLLGPLLEYPSIQYVKAFYERPLWESSQIKKSGGGRVTEILIRPLFSLFYPDLACFIQPLSGEYAGRRTLLDSLSFSIGYGVELGHLLDIFHNFGIDSFAQVDMDLRVHRNQSLPALSKMSFSILSTFLAKLKSYNRVDMNIAPLKHYVSLLNRKGEYEISLEDIAAIERPPMNTIEEYRKKFPRSDS